MNCPFSSSTIVTLRSVLIPPGIMAITVAVWDTGAPGDMLWRKRSFPFSLPSTVYNGSFNVALIVIDAL
ncbi:MAG: hypothetical protein ACPGZU_07300 [Ketobacter sp.]